MHTPEADGALRWLAEEGLTPLGPGRWREVTPSGGLERTDHDLAHEWAAAALADDRVPPSQQLRLGLGLLDLFDEYWVTVELGFFVAEQDDPAVIEAFWAGYRQRLEGPEPGTQLLYSLWVDWFADPSRSASAFAAVIGDDVRSLRARQRLGDLAEPPLCRRVGRVLENSGPVRWADKHDVYEAVVAVAELRPALFKGLLAGYHDVYGDLEPEQALDLLGRLDLPPETEHLATLRAVLKTGAHNHYRKPELWDAVRQV